MRIRLSICRTACGLENCIWMTDRARSVLSSSLWILRSLLLRKVPPFGCRNVKLTVTATCYRDQECMEPQLHSPTRIPAVVRIRRGRVIQLVPCVVKFRFSASQKISRHLWNSEIHECIHKSSLGEWLVLINHVHYLQFRLTLSGCSDTVSTTFGVGPSNFSIHNCNRFPTSF